MKFRWFHKLIFYDLYFEYYSSNASNIFIQENIFIFIMTYCRNNIFIHTLYFFYTRCCHLPKTKTFLPFIWQILQSQHHCFHLSFYQQLICWIIKVLWLGSVITKTKHFFIKIKRLSKIFINIFNFKFIY